MKIDVELHTFVGGKVRTVNVPDDRLGGIGSLTKDLDEIFKYGQNCFQPQGLPSVSVGDVIRYVGKRYRVDNFGFEEVTLVA